ncbi:MAG: MlaD family protein [Alphaproteobacteria bacterium]
MAISSETKVGLLVLAAAGGFGWLGMQSGNFGLGGVNNARELSSVFSDASGLSIGAPVKFSGVPVGAVTDIRLAPNGGAEITFTVKNDAPLPAGVAAQITTNGLIGEKYLALMTGAATAGQLAPEATSIPSAGTVAPEDIASNFSKVADDLGAITSSLRSAIGGPENASKLQNIVNSFEGFSGRLDQMLNKEIGQGDIGEIVGNLKAASASLKDLLGGVDGKGTGQMLGNFSKTAENLAKITERLERGEGLLGQMMSDNPQNNTLVADLQQAAKDLKAITGKVNSGDGTIGKLVNDPDIADKLSSTLDTFSGAAERLESFRTEVDASGYNLVAENGVSKGSLQVTLAPRPTRYYVLGVTADGLANESDNTEGTSPYHNKHFGNQTKFTAQFGQVYENAFFGQDLGLRFGLKESSGGIGADSTVALPFKNRFVDNMVRVSADVYDWGGENSNDVDAPHVDLKAKVGIKGIFDNNMYGLLGYDNMLNQEYGSPIVGLGYKFQDDDLKYVVGAGL